MTSVHHHVDACRHSKGHLNAEKTKQHVTRNLAVIAIITWQTPALDTLFAKAHNLGASQRQIMKEKTSNRGTGPRLRWSVTLRRHARGHGQKQLATFGWQSLNASGSLEARPGARRTAHSILQIGVLWQNTIELRLCGNTFQTDPRAWCEYLSRAGAQVLRPDAAAPALLKVAKSGHKAPFTGSGIKDHVSTLLPFGETTAHVHDKVRVLLSGPADMMACLHGCWDANFQPEFRSPRRMLLEAEEPPALFATKHVQT